MAVLCDLPRDSGSRPAPLLSALVLAALVALTHALSAGTAGLAPLSFEASLTFAALVLRGAHAPVLLMAGVLVPASAQIVGST